MEETHESYGLIGISRITGGDNVLFGSGIRHREMVRLTISRAVFYRSLSNNWYHARDELIEVDMSPLQWANLISTMNMSPGTPCTIRHVQGVQAAPPPETSERKVIQDEFEATMAGVARKFDDVIAKVEELLNKKSVSKAELRKVLGRLKMVHQDVACNAPFVHKQFDEAMENTIAEAKSEIEAFLATSVMQAGYEAVAAKMTSPKMLENHSERTGVRKTPGEVVEEQERFCRERSETK